MFTIKVFEDTVLNFRELHLALEQGHKSFLIDEGADISELRVGNLSLVDLLKDRGVEICTFNLAQDDITGIRIIKNDGLVPFLNFAKDKRVHDMPKKIEKHFGLFVGGSRWHRLMLAGYLFDQHADKSIISYRQTVFRKDQPCNLRIDDLLLNCFKHNDKIWPRINKLVQNLPLKATDEPNDNLGYINFDQSWNINTMYEKIFLDVVCETWHNGKTFYPTEKIARALVCRTPFLVYAGKDFLSNLRRFGFRTFEQFWDESYDAHSGVDRIIKMQTILKRIADKTTQELKSMTAQMKNILDHNVEVYNSLSNQPALAKLLNNLDLKI